MDSYLGDSAGGQMAAALSIRWRREVLQKQKSGDARGDLSDSPLPPIRMQVLIYPALQLVDMFTVSNVISVDVMHRRSLLCRFVPLLLLPDRQLERSLIDAICAGNHTTRASRERLAEYLRFGPVDGSEDEVHCLYLCSLSTASSTN